MSSWLISANLKLYDVFSAFEQDETYWPQNANLLVNDTVHIYLASPIQQIGFVCTVLGTDFDYAKICNHIIPFIKTHPDRSAHNKPFMKLKPICALQVERNSEVSLKKLRENGLKGMLLGARRLENNPQLMRYLKKVII